MDLNSLKKTGVIAASAGNHAQGLSFFAEKLGIKATIVMPTSTPFIKIARTERYGAHVILHGSDVTDAERHALDIAAEKGYVMVHPFDDKEIIAGQGTIGLELHEEHPDFDAILVPIGGGGVISGIATAYKHLSPETKIYGAEAAVFPSMYNAIHSKEAKIGGATVAEGIAIKRPGTLTVPLVKQLVDDIFLVEESDIEEAIFSLCYSQKLVIEGAAASTLAALATHQETFTGKKICLVLCGGNIDPMLLTNIMHRYLSRRGLIVQLQVVAPTQAHSFSTAMEVVSRYNSNILDLAIDRTPHDQPIKHSALNMTLEVRDGDHLKEIMSAMDRKGLPVQQIEKWSS